MDFNTSAWITAAARPEFLHDGVLRDVLEYVGRKDGHQWGEKVAADVEFSMAIDTIASRPESGHRCHSGF